MGRRDYPALAGPAGHIQGSLMGLRNDTERTGGTVGGQVGRRAGNLLGARNLEVV